MSKQSEFEEKAEAEETAGAIDEIAAIMEENNPAFQPGASIQSVVAHQSFENIEKAIKTEFFQRLRGLRGPLSVLHKWFIGKLSL